MDMGGNPIWRKASKSWRWQTHKYQRKVGTSNPSSIVSNRERLDRTVADIICVREQKPDAHTANKMFSD